MTVRLDLRPDRLDESGERAVNAAGVLCFSSFLIFVLSFVTFFCVAGRAFYVAAAADGYSEANKTYEARIAAADAELKALTASNGRASGDLDFVFGGVPALEFLDCVSASLNDGIVIESIELSQDSALIKGAAFSDGGVLAFAEALERSYVVSAVGVPAVTSSSERGAPEIKNFSLDVKLHNIRDILLFSDARGGAFFEWNAA